MIKVENITKIYKQPIKEAGLKGAIKHYYAPKFAEKVAVKDISFTINDGESVAYLGRNGAGKSTTIKMLTGIMKPTSGSIYVDNKNPQKNRIEYVKDIGVVFGQRTQMWWDISIEESLKLIKEIYNINDFEYKKNLNTFCDILALDEFIHLSARKISLGQRMRADIAAALLHNPKIIYLDEPTIGLDIFAKEKIREFIRYINQNFNTTVLLTTHDLDDIQKICDRLILIDKGEIIYDGTLEYVINKYSQNKKIKLKVGDEGFKISEIQELENKGYDYEISNSNELTITFNTLQYTTSEVISNLLEIIKINDILVEEMSFEEILKQIYEGKFD